MKYPFTGKLKVAVIGIGCALCFFGAALERWSVLVLFGLLLLVVAHPQILEKRA